MTRDTVAPARVTKHLCVSLRLVEAHPTTMGPPR